MSISPCTASRVSDNLGVGWKRLMAVSDAELPLGAGDGVLNSRIGRSFSHGSVLSWKKHVSMSRRVKR